MKKLWLLCMLLPLVVYSSKKNEHYGEIVCVKPQPLLNLSVHKDESDRFKDKYRSIVMRDDVDTVRQFVETGGNINAEGGFLLYQALYNGSENIARYLLNHPDIDVNASGLWGHMTPLLSVVAYYSNPTPAQQAKRLKVLQLLLRHPELNINVQSPSGHTALYYAAREDNVAAVELLLRYGARITADLSKEKLSDPIQNLLQSAKEFEPAVAAMPEFPQEVYGMLFEKMSGPISKKDVTREKLLQKEGVTREKLRQMLKDEKNSLIIDFSLLPPSVMDEPDELGYTPLHLAVLYKRPDAVRYLLVMGANTSLRTFGGKTALDLAETDEMRKVFEDFEKSEQEEKEHVKEAKLHKELPDIFIAAAKGYAQEVQEYIQGGGNINRLNDEGLTSLMLAARAGNTVVVQMLLGAGVDTSMVNNDHETALVLAARAGKIDVVRLLLERMQLEDVVLRNTQNKNAYDIARGKLRDAYKKNTITELRLRTAKADPKKSKRFALLHGISQKKARGFQEIVDMLAKYKGVKEREVKRKEKKA